MHPLPPHFSPNRSTLTRHHKVTYSRLMVLSLHNGDLLWRGLSSLSLSVESSLVSKTAKSLIINYCMCYQKVFARQTNLCWKVFPQKKLVGQKSLPSLVWRFFFIENSRLKPGTWELALPAHLDFLAIIKRSAYFERSGDKELNFDPNHCKRTVLSLIIISLELEWYDARRWFSGMSLLRTANRSTHFLPCSLSQAFAATQRTHRARQHKASLNINNRDKKCLSPVEKERELASRRLIS